MSTFSDDANELIASAVSSGAGANREALANLLASCIERRRRQMGLSVNRAAACRNPHLAVESARERLGSV